MNCLILDDHPLVCIAIEHTLKDLACIADIYSCANPNHAMAIIEEKEVDLLIIDINLKEHNGFDLYRRFRAKDYQGKALFFSSENSILYSDMAQRIGADGYVDKSETKETLRDAIINIDKGYSFFKHSSPQSSNKRQLSARETIVMNHLLQGKSNKQIANILSISDKTVSTYKKRLMQKYKVTNLIELTHAVSL